MEEKWSEWLSGEKANFGCDYSTSDEVAIVLRKFHRSRLGVSPLDSIHLPSGRQAHLGTVELFTEIKEAIVEHFRLSGRVSALLAFWVFSTWFQEALSLAPCLVVTGPANEGDAVLRILRALCYHSVLVNGLNKAFMEMIYIRRVIPTFLISEPNLTQRAGALLGTWTTKGYMVPSKDGYFVDYFGPKAVYAGEDLSKNSMPQNSVHIHVVTTGGVELNHAQHVFEKIAIGLQKQLLNYRHLNMIHVSESSFCVTSLSSEANAVASALGTCIVDAPDLQAQIVSLLTPQAEQQNADRLGQLEVLTVIAALSLCHQGKDQIFVAEIAAEVNRAQAERGDRLRFSAEKVGHKLSKVGLAGRRLSKAGNGLLFDQATRILLHEIAANYGALEYSRSDDDVPCPQCAKIEQPIETKQEASVLE